MKQQFDEFQETLDKKVYGGFTMWMDYDNHQAVSLWTIVRTSLNRRLLFNDYFNILNMVVGG